MPSHAQEWLRGAATRPQGAMAPIVLAGSIGTVIEWYDFLIYGTAAALVFNTQFFPRLDPLSGTLASLATYAVGFFARPFGGMVFGHFGDRLGRKVSLLLTILITGGGTFAVGLLPTYAQVGIAAPVLLVVLRVLQGFGLGGEWAGASLMVVEHAPQGSRGICGSLVQLGFPLGLVCSYGVFGAVSASMPDSDFQAWGWRIPFLASALLLAVGWYVRARVPETPVFERLRSSGQVLARPLADATARHARSFVVAIGLKLSEVSWVYILSVFAVVYGTATLGLPKKVMLDALFFAALVEVAAIPLFGWLSDRWGRKTLYYIGTLFTIAFAFPFFRLLDTRDPFTITLAMTVALNLGHGTMFGLQSAFFPELFGTRVRYTGASLGFQVSAALGGGLAPLLATALSGYLGGTAGVSALVIGLAGLTLVATVFAPETRRRSLDE